MAHFGLKWSKLIVINKDSIDRAEKLKSLGDTKMSHINRLELDHQKKFQFHASGRKLVLTLAILITLGAMMQIWVLNRLSTFGEKISQIERNKTSLKMENQILENQIAQYSALQKIKVQASNLGFQTSKNIEYWQADGLAMNQTKVDSLAR